MTRLLSLLYRDLPEGQALDGGAARARLARFEQHLEAIAAARGEPPILVQSPRDLPAVRTPFILTVDGGGLAYLQLAQRLEERGWLGHCLVASGAIGRRGFLGAEDLRELHARGHVIGSHTTSRPPSFHRLSWRDQVEEWKRSKATLEDLLGAQVNVGSVPGGHCSERVARAARAAGLRVLFTSLPRRRVRRVGGCHVLGRYLLRHDSPPEHAARLVRQQADILLREWLIWNGRNALKGARDLAHLRLPQWLQRV